METPDQKQAWNDNRIEGIIGNLLRVGVLIASAVVILGAVIYLMRHGMEPAQHTIFRGEPRDFCTVGGAFREAFDWRGRGIILVGLLLLIATPIARVVFSLAGFALQRDRTYVVITLIVLVFLLYGLIGHACG